MRRMRLHNTLAGVVVMALVLSGCSSPRRHATDKPPRSTAAVAQAGPKAMGGHSSPPPPHATTSSAPVRHGGSIAGSGGVSTGSSAGGSGEVAPVATTVPVVAPTVTTAPAQGEPYVVPSSDPVYEATFADINSAREGEGLPPAQGWATSAPSLGAYPQQCALHWSGHCASNEVETGVLSVSASAAVALWEGSPEHWAILMEPGAQELYIGWAANVGGADVVVVDVCGSAPGNEASCPG